MPTVLPMDLYIGERYYRPTTPRCHHQGDYELRRTATSTSPLSVLSLSVERRAQSRGRVQKRCFRRLVCNSKPLSEPFLACETLSFIPLAVCGEQARLTLQPCVQLCINLRQNRSWFVRRWA